MKKHLLALGLLGLASCSSSANDKPTAVAPPAEDPTHAAVSAYLKKTLDDPASYQPARWGKVRTWRQQDANQLAADKAMLFAKDDMDNAKHGMHSQSAYGKKLFDEAATRAKHYQHKADSLLKADDPTTLGRALTHSYRAKNRMGAIQLDSAHFVVYNNGKVERL